MESRVKVFGHPLHPMLIVFPLGLLATAVLFDIIGLFSESIHWATVSYYMIPAGIIGGLIAAVPGFLDWLAIPRQTRAHRVGRLHAIANVSVLVLFGISWLLRPGSEVEPGGGAVFLGILGAGLATVGGWLGGELVDRMGVGVDDGANLNAPNSLTAKKASPRRGPERAA